MGTNRKRTLDYHISEVFRMHPDGLADALAPRFEDLDCTVLRFERSTSSSIDSRAGLDVELFNYTISLAFSLALDIQ